MSFPQAILKLFKSRHKPITVGLTAEAKANPPKHVAVIMDGNGRWARSEAYHVVVGTMPALKIYMNSANGALSTVLTMLLFLPFLLKIGNAKRKLIL